MKLSIKDQIWLNHIKAWKSSNLSQSQYCKQPGINVKSFSSRKSDLVKNGFFVEEDSRNSFME